MILPPHRTKQANLIAMNLQAAFTALSIAQKEIDHIQYLYSDIPHPVFNCIIQAQSSTETIQSSIRAIFQDYKQNNIPHCWWVTEQFTPDNIREELLSSNYQKGPLYRGVHAELKKLNLTFETNPKVHIKRIQEASEFDDWVRPIQEGFEFNDLVTNAFVSRYKKLHITDHRFISYIAYYDNQLAGSLTLFVNANVAGLYNGAVLTPFRRKGIMLALGKNALLEAREKGLKDAVSQVGEGTYPLSINIGFKEYLGFQAFLS